METSIHTFQVKDNMDVNGERMFVWSLSFMTINGKTKIKAKTLSGKLIEIKQ